MARNRGLLIAVLLLAVALLAGCGKQGEEKGGPSSAASPAPQTATGGRKVLYWFDPMQPGTHFDHPGKSPFMDMELVPKYADEATPPQGGSPGSGATVTLSPQEVSAAGVGTTEVKPSLLYRVVRAEGVLGTDETTLVHIAARVAGRLDRLDLDFTGETVRRGAPIYSIYSPDLVASGREYALALENLERARTGGDAGYIRSAESLAQASRERLALWGLDREQIDRIARTRQPEVDLVVRSPAGGTVLEKKVVQGQYVAAGQDLYLLADLSRLWLSVKVYEQELGGIEVGQLAVARRGCASSCRIPAACSSRGCSPPPSCGSTSATGSPSRRAPSSTPGCGRSSTSRWRRAASPAARCASAPRPET